MFVQLAQMDSMLILSKLVLLVLKNVILVLLVLMSAQVAVLDTMLTSRMEV